MTMEIIANSITGIVQTVWDTSKIYVFWTVMHFATTNLYAHFCAKMTTWGFFTSPLMAQAPHCKGLNWLRDLSIKTLDNYWVWSVTWIAGKFTGVLGGITVVQSPYTKSKEM